jgi:flagellar basal-body rod modification protein FlgD
MDATEYTNQLVQYSNVEQSIQTNSKLDQLLSLSIYNLGVQATGYVGQTVQVIGDVMPLENGVAKATYNLGQNVADTGIMIKDMNGNIVYTASGETTAGNHDFLWDGKNNFGEQLPDGAYQIIINPQAISGQAAPAVTTTVYGRVTGVASDDKGIYIGLGDATTTTIDSILTSRGSGYWDEIIASVKGNNDALTNENA